LRPWEKKQETRVLAATVWRGGVVPHIGTPGPEKNATEKLRGKSSENIAEKKKDMKDRPGSYQWTPSSIAVVKALADEL